VTPPRASRRASPLYVVIPFAGASYLADPKASEDRHLHQIQDDGKDPGCNE